MLAQSFASQVSHSQKHTHAHTHTHTHSHTHTLTHTHSLSHTHSLTRSHTPNQSPTHPLIHPRPHSLTPTQSFIHSSTHLRTHALTFTRSMRTSPDAVVAARSMAQCQGWALAHVHLLVCLPLWSCAKTRGVQVGEGWAPGDRGYPFWLSRGESFMFCKSV